MKDEDRRPFKRTLLVLLIERELHINMVIDLRRKYRAGWTLRQLAEHYGISPTTAGTYIRQLGFGLHQRAALGWEQVPEVLELIDGQNDATG